MAREKRTLCCQVDELIRLLANSGWTIKQLAKQSGVDAKTISRMLDGVGVFRTNIALVAKALNVLPEVLIAPANTQPEHSSAHQALRYQLQFSFSGQVFSPEQASFLANAVPDIVARLQSRGIAATIERSMLVLTESADDFRRRFVRLYALFSEECQRPDVVNIGYVIFQSKYGEACQMWATIKPSKYEAFLEAVGSRTLCLHDFDQYGELIDVLEFRSVVDVMAGPLIVPHFADYCHSFAVEPVKCVFPDSRRIEPGATITPEVIDFYLRNIGSVQEL